MGYVSERDIRHMLKTEFPFLTVQAIDCIISSISK